MLISELGRNTKYRYCFDLFQHVLFILIQAAQNCEIKTKAFVIIYCVLDLSKICINSSYPSFQLVGGYNKFSLRTTYSKYSASSSSTPFIINVAFSIRFFSSEYGQSIFESLISALWFCSPDNSGKKEQLVWPSRDSIKSCSSNIVDVPLKFYLFKFVLEQR